MTKRSIKKAAALLALLVLAAAALAGCSGSSVPKGQNCLTDPSFASASGSRADGWYFDSYRNAPDGCTFEQGAGPNGETAVKLTLSENNDARLVQEVGCKRGTVYKFTVLCKTQDIPGGEATGANLSVIGVFSHSEALSGTNDWTTLTFYGRTAPNQTSLTVALRIGFYSSENRGTAWFTNASMTEIDASEVPAGAEIVSLENRLSQSSNPEAERTSSESAGIIVKGVLFAAALLLIYAIMSRFSAPGRTTRLCVLVGLVAVGLIVRIYYATHYRGFNVDMNCFWSWGARMLSQGPFRFYSAGSFCDYPPLYMLLLALPSAVIQLLGLTASSSAGWLVLKSPAIICDIIIACIIFRIADRKYPKMSLLLAAAYLLNPAVIVDSASWGQADSVLMVFLVLAIYYIIKNKMWLSVIYYALALLIKPQALLLAPVMLVGAITFTVRALSGHLRGMEPALCRKQALWFLLSMLGILAGFVLISVAMRNDQEWYWLLTKYFGTMGSYRYATLSAFNLMALLGGQWAADTTPVIGGMSYMVLGIILLAAVFAVFAYLYYYKRSPMNRHLFLLGAWLIAGIFVLGPYMHERYLYPVLALLLLAFVVYGDRRLLIAFAGFSVTSYINVAQVLYLHYEPSNANGLGYFAADDPLLLVCSGINLLLFVYLTYVTFSIRIKGGAADPALMQAPAAAEAGVPEPLAAELLAEAPAFNPPRPGKRFLSGRDWAIMLGVTVAYSVITLLNLGSLNTPEQYWDTKTGQQITVDFGAVTPVQRFYVNSSICDNSFYYSGKSYGGGLTVEYSADGQSWSTLTTYCFDNGDMFKWANDKNTYSDISARYVRLTSKASGSRINEMIFFASADSLEPIAIASVSSDGTTISGSELSSYAEHGAFALFNEQYTAVTKPSYYTGMIFDEIYHARTAYEMINGWRIYEWTHPPLGKAIMSLGIRIFGMNPFGWRFMGNLMGILMLPAMYCLGKLMFKKTSWATALMLLMTFDGMHFIQTRLATIDSYGVFFIILMYLFMYKYYTMSWNRDSLIKTFIPLGLCGISFGLGVASKWIGAYAGVGLAFLFFFTVLRRTREYAAAGRSLKNASLSQQQRGELERIRKIFLKNLTLTVLFCVLFFVIIPLIIYCLSYGAYFDAPGNKGSALNTIWQNQKDMLSYHESITNDTNYWQSPWYQWPIMWHTYWYYQAPELTGDAMGTIAAMGNPLIWWFGLASAIGCAVIFVRKLIKQGKITDPEARVHMGRDIRLLGFALTGYAVNYGAWALIPRSTFIYHYFASLPFIMIFAVYMLRQFYCSVSIKHKRLAAAGVIAFLAACFILACMFYPVWSGIETSKQYVSTWLWWLPSYSYNGIGQGWHFYN